MEYQLLEKQKIRFIGLVLLNEIINFQHYFPVKLGGEDVYLEHYLKTLAENGMLAIENGQYIPTEAGRNEVVNLYEKYQEYLKLFDLFCAVDLEAGEFAFERAFDETLSEDAWAEHINAERFSDVRVAVADFKGIDPLEIVFLSFLNEGRFNCGVDRWQHALTGDDAWREIEEICNTAISREYLEADGVLVDVIKQGSEIALRLLKEAEAILTEEEEESNEEIIEEETTEEIIEYVDVVEMPVYGYSYYDPYYDPYYVSPIWLVPVLLW